MQVAIIAGGLATRLGPLTESKPKSLMPICDRPFIEYQFELLKKGGVDDVVLCLGHFGDQIETHCGDGSRFGLKIKYSRENRQLGTTGALKLAEPLLEDPFFTLYGDSYVFVDFQHMANYASNRGLPALMSVFDNYNKYDTSNTAVKNGLVTCYRKEKTAGLTWIDYGVNWFRKEALRLVPEDKPYSLEMLFSRLIARRELAAYEVTERFYEIGSVNGIKECSDYIRRCHDSVASAFTDYPGRGRH